MAGDTSDFGWRAHPRAPVSLPETVIRALRDFRRERFPKATRPRLDASVREISDAFTTERSSLPGSYLNQPPVRSAYLAHFHPQQLLRGMAAVEETFARAKVREVATPERVRVADLGAGLGAMTQSLLLVDDAPDPAEVVFVDHQRSAVQDARDLTLRVHGCTSRGGEPPRIRTAVERIDMWLGRARAAGWRYDVVLAGAVLNEIRGPWEPILDGIRAILEPGGIALIVEPAQDDVARRLMALRESALGTVSSLAPCTHDGACPLLALTRDWCFTVRRTDLPEEVVRRSRLLGHQVEQLRYSLWAFVNSEVARGAEEPLARIVSDAMEGEHVLCTAAGRAHVRAVFGAVRGDLAEPARA